MELHCYADNYQMIVKEIRVYDCEVCIYFICPKCGKTVYNKIVYPIGENININRIS